MTPTTEQQAQAIRRAIKALEYEQHLEMRRPHGPEAEYIQSLDSDIAALESAIEALKVYTGLRASIKAALWMAMAE